MEAVLDRVRIGRTPADLKQAILENLYYVQTRIPELATTNDWYMAVAYAVRDRMMNDWIEAFGGMRRKRTRIVSYLSAEFLIGPQLGNNMLCVHDIYSAVDQALRELGQDLTKLLEHEPEPGLGNGGLGRLAACYMDSLTTLNIPAIGYGIRYEFGLHVRIAQTVISEVGLDMSRWKTEKHFAAWLGLCPDNRTSGGKVLQRGTRRVVNRAATALRLAAWSLIRSRSALGAKFRRLRSRLWAPKAITAMAHTLFSTCLSHAQVRSTVCGSRNRILRS